MGNRRHPADDRAWPMRKIPGSNRGKLGPFNYDLEPLPFNPAYDPRAKDWSKQAAESMERDGFYDKHTRAECAAEWRRRYDAIQQAAGPLNPV